VVLVGLEMIEKYPAASRLIEILFARELVHPLESN